jgi:hypothetical protein
MNEKMLYHLKGFLIDLSALMALYLMVVSKFYWLGLILIGLEPQVIAALGAVIVGRLLDWAREEWKERRKKKRPQSKEPRK